jgi:tetratricopeptide (TPR) repeat protein
MTDHDAQRAASGLAHFERARLLIEQGRFDMAEQDLRLMLAEAPEFAFGHSLLALCLLERKAYQEATDEAQQGVHLAPDEGQSYYFLALVYARRNHLDEAERILEEAIALDPHNDGYFALFASVKFQKKDWHGALNAAEQGLAIDPVNVECLNIRAMAQVKLGRKVDAAETIQAALAKAPDDSGTHANLGWTLLESGDRKQALHHFREALRLDPQNDWARSGIVETLKARNIVYRLMLTYFLWMSKLSSGAQWGVIIGAWVAIQILKAVSRNNPEMTVWVQPLVWLYFAFVVLTWIADPLFNLMLRLSRDGRLALSREEIVASNWIGSFILLALICFVFGLIYPDSGIIFAALVCGLMVLPVSAVFKCTEGWPRNWMTVYAIGMGLCGLTLVGADISQIALGDTQKEIAALLGLIWLPSFFVFIAGIFLTGFVANWLIMQRPKR